MDEVRHPAGQLLASARAGNGEAFAQLVEPYRHELHVHCYRILGSVQDAEDVLQETMMAAWRGLAGFEERASMRTWLYRIATNKCLNQLRGNRSRFQYTPEVQFPEPTRIVEPVWLQPYPDEFLGDIPDTAPGPEAKYEIRESVSLAFVTALQHLTPGQRAALVLRDVMGFSAAETAGMLDTTVDSVNGWLKRARWTIAEHLPPGGQERAPLPDSTQERQVVASFADAFERGDVSGIVAMLTDDVWLRMPPLPLEYQGRATAGHFLAVIGFRDSRQFRLIPTRANGQPAFGAYLLDPQARIYRAHGLIVLTLAGEQVCVISRFIDNSVMPHFGFPRTLPE